MMKIKGIYIHIPFCKDVCSYCDFYKMIANETKIEKYVDYLIKEINLENQKIEANPTLFLGGGTPSRLNICLLEKIISKVKDKYQVTNFSEATIECNPNDITLEYAIGLKELGFNRISLGVQSFNDDKLRFLGRHHNALQVKNAINILKSVGLTNINIDLIYGVPFDNIDLIKEDLDIFYSLDIPHLSFYSLILEEHTMIYNDYLKGMFEWIDEDLEASIYNFIVNNLEQHGYNRYEISNFSRSGFESKHNMIYWKGEEYLGFGANASKYINNERMTNINNLEKYYYGIDNEELNLIEHERLDKIAQEKETMMLGLRLTKGVNIEEFMNKFNSSPIDLYKSIIDKYVRLNILEVKDGYIRIKKDKFFISNQVMMEFI